MLTSLLPIDKPVSHHGVTFQVVSPGHRCPVCRVIREVPLDSTGNISCPECNVSWVLGMSYIMMSVGFEVRQVSELQEALAEKDVYTEEPA